MTDSTPNDDLHAELAAWAGQPREQRTSTAGRGPSHHHRSDDHPAIGRLHAELAAARRGIGHIAAMSPSHRERVMAAIRSELPDAASRTAHEVGGAATMAEIRHFDGDEPGQPVPSSAARLWDAILTDMVEAVCAAR